MSKAYSIVKTFEEEIAHWAGAEYGVAISSCCNAIFLCLKYINRQNTFRNIVEIPKFTYPGVAMAIINAGYKIKFRNEKWKGIYWLSDFAIIDSALRFKKGMYIKDTFYCLSFHYKKHLPIGRGGMILTDNKWAVEWFKMTRFDGRSEIPLSEDNATIIGWNMYMTPEQTSRGLTLFEVIKDKNLPDLKVEEQGYPDLSKWRCFK